MDLDEEHMYSFLLEDGCVRKLVMWMVFCIRRYYFGRCYRGIQSVLLETLVGGLHAAPILFHVQVLPHAQRMGHDTGYHSNQLKYIAILQHVETCPLWDIERWGNPLTEFNKPH